jgi:sigma-B regulation protein RsbU (phosphoserine phosphatase)
VDILIVDDSRVSRLVLTRTLKKLGHRVVVAMNGKEAWTVFQNEPVSLLISDWLMPEMNGVELCRAIREHPQPHYTYIILLTVLNGKGPFVEGLDAGADDFISKPFDEEMLAARLRVAQRILSLQREVGQLREILPICMYCKKIRNDQNYWQQVEAYFGKHAGTKFTHGFCPDCYEKIVKPQLQDFANEEKQSNPSDAKNDTSPGNC